MFLSLRTTLLLLLLLLFGRAAASRMGLWYNSHLSCAGHHNGLLLLSVVVTTNNRAPADQLQRLQFQVDNFAAFADAHGLMRRIEYIIVEYNYDPARPGLSSLLTFNADYMPLVRVIRVSPEEHATISSRIGFTGYIEFNEFYAKNIGIKRACAPFVIVTAADILFPESFFAELARPNSLRREAYYRAPRCNSEAQQRDLENRTAADRIAFARARIKSCWDCEAGDVRVYRGVRDAPDARLPASGAKHAVCIGAPGDFLLMSRERWFAYGGYPDVAMPAMLDDVPVYQAAADGAELIQFPAPTCALHINHEKGYRVDDRDKMFEQMSRIYDFPTEFRQMMEHRKARVYNDASWGYGGVILPEDWF